MSRSTAGDGHPAQDATLRQAVDAAVALARGQAQRILATVDHLAAAGWPAEEAKSAWLDLMATLGTESAEFGQAIKRTAVRVGLPTSASERMLAYLLLHVGEPVAGDALAGVAGIDSWARRLRELRVEEGWPISLPETRSNLGPGLYVLKADYRDERAGEEWSMAHRIRNMKDARGRRLAGDKRMLEFFKANVGQVVTKEQLEYVAYPIKERARRVREFTERGWQIESNFDRRGMPSGAYMMIAPEQLDSKSRQPIKQRNKLLKAAAYRCTTCGGDPERDPTIRLQVHHVVPVYRGGGNDDENLKVLCDACHAGEHAVDCERVVDELRRPEIERDYA